MRNGKAFKKNMNIIPNINERTPMIIDREEYLESSVKTRPIHTAAIPKHTKEKPIIKEMNEDETIG